MSARKPPHDLPDTDDPYALLGVSPGASDDQIRRAYLRQVKVFKPDRHPEEFRRVRAAYDQLREQESWFKAWAEAHADDDAPGDDPAAATHGGEPEATQGDGAGLGEPGLEDPSGTVDAKPGDREIDGPGGDGAARTGDEPSLDAEHPDPRDLPHPDPAHPDPRDPPPLDAEHPDPRDRSSSRRDGERSPRPGDRRAHVGPRVTPRPPRPSRALDVIARLDALVEAAQDELVEERYGEAVARLLAPEAETLATRPEFGPLLLEVACAAVWAAPEGFDELVARYGDLIVEYDASHRDGVLLHKRTLATELPGWRAAVNGWPELRRFVALGASLRAPAEAELGLRLGRRAAAEPGSYLEVMVRAAEQAPGIVALFVGMSERWTRLYGRLVPDAPVRPATAPSTREAAKVLVQSLLRHRQVRWEQVRPLLVTLGVGLVLMLGRSPLFDLAIIVALVGMGLQQLRKTSPEERIYARVLRPAAATWLWSTGASPDELAVALAANLPAAGTTAAVLHPVDLGAYPERLGRDLALLAFASTAPMIPLLGPRRPR